MKLRTSSFSLVGAFLLLLSISSARAATFNIANGDVAGLKTAITSANGNGQDDTIELAAGGVYNLTGRDSLVNGLPQLGPDGGHKLTIHGVGTTIQRSSAGGTITFRIFSTLGGSNVTLSGLTLTNGNLSSGNPIAHAGAIYCNFDEAGNTVLTLSNCTITNNSADYGGAIFNDGLGGNAALIITNSTFSGNSSLNNGGAIFNDGSSSGSATLTVSGSTFSGNSNGHNGGGAIQQDGSNGTAAGSIVNSTFSQNSSAGNGGSIYMDGSAGSANLSVSNCTFSLNTAATPTSGDSIYVNRGATGSAILQIGNTILKNGASRANLATNNGTVTSQGYNLSSDDAGGGVGSAPGGFLNHAGDRRNTDPLLDPLGLRSNGGATMTIALQANSPALDQGKRDTISLINNDQRGVYRPFDDPNIVNAVGGDGSDIGAYEADVRNTNVERIGNDLRVTFTTITGRNYEIQHVTSLNGTWTQVPNTVPPPPIAGTGGVIQVTVPNAFTNPGSNFYRVNELP